MGLPLRKQFSRDLRLAWRWTFGVRKMEMVILEYDRYWELQQAGVGTEPSPREMIFADHIAPNSSVLDIGCGTGRFLSYLLRTKHDITIYGLDISPRAIELARSKGIPCEVEDVASPAFQLSQVFDYIVVSEVLEHLPNPESVLTRLKGKFRKSLLITIPNIGWYPHRLRLLFGSFPYQTARHPGEHLRYWTIRDFKQWMDRLGYSLDEVIPSNGFPFLARLWPNMFGHQIVFVVPPPVSPPDAYRES